MINILIRPYLLPRTPLSRVQNKIQYIYHVCIPVKYADTPSHQKISQFTQFPRWLDSEINPRRPTDDPLLPENFRKKSFALFFSGLFASLRYGDQQRYIQTSTSTSTFLSRSVRENVPLAGRRQRHFVLTCYSTARATAATSAAIAAAAAVGATG